MLARPSPALHASAMLGRHLAEETSSCSRLNGPNPAEAHSRRSTLVASLGQANSYMQDPAIWDYRVGKRLVI